MYDLVMTSNQTIEPGEISFDDPRVREWVDYDPTNADRRVRRFTSIIWDHWFRYRAYGAEHVPKTGAFILVANHSSYMDPFLHVYGQSRILRFMSKSNLFENKLTAGFSRACGGFPVRRGTGDQLAMTIARAVLADGQGLVVYPEGTRFRKSLPLGPARRGAARLALEMRVPIVPAACVGIKEPRLYGRRRWQRKQVTMIYGKPMDFSDRDNTPDEAAKVRDEIWQRVTELYDEARQIDASRRK